MNIQLLDIQKQKNKALKVLVETKTKLEKVADQARKYMSTNSTMIDSLKNDIDDLAQTNEHLMGHINQVERSIAETDKILNPESTKTQVGF